MEQIIKKQAYMTQYSTSSSLSMHKDSQTISKVKPKIRIIHIFAPEIIKTDVANFRELVQRLTGKPTTRDLQKGCKKKPRIPRRGQEPRTTTTTTTTTTNVHDNPSNKVELRSGFLGLAAESRERVKEEADAEMWNINNNSNGENSSSGGGFLNGFADFDGFIQELGEFPLFAMDSSSHHMHAFEETQLA